MKPKWSLILALTILGSFILISELQANPADQKAAVTASATWLSLVDDGKYSESWDQAAELLKNAVTKEQLLTSSKRFGLRLVKW